jgi:hypothetical protein
VSEAFVVDPVAPERFSMSFVRAAEGCLRRAHLEREFSSSGPDAIIGHLVHEIAAAVGFACVMRGTDRPDPGEARRIALAVMGSPDEAEPLAAEVYDDVLSLVERMESRLVFRPTEQFEIDSRIEFAGRTLSARIDRLAIEDGVAYSTDYKTGRKRPATSRPLQGTIYGWHVLKAHPEVGVVFYEEEHPRFRLRTTEVIGEPFRIERSEIPAIEEFLTTAIRRIEAAYAEGGELPATPGDACSYPTGCPVAATCPVPRWARPVTWLETEDDAIATFEQLLVHEAQTESEKAALKGWLARTERRALQYRGEEIGWSPENGKSFDRKRLQADLHERGEAIELDSYNKPSAPQFGRRKAR